METDTTNTPGSYCTVAARKVQRAVQVLEISFGMNCCVCVVKIEVASYSLIMNNEHTIVHFNRLRYRLDFTA